jgi:protein-disulfide isomerase
MSFAALVEACLSKKGLALIIPALLLVGSTLAIGQGAMPPAAPPSQAAAPKSEPASTPAPAAQPVQAEAAKPAVILAASELSSGQRKEVEAIIKDYLINNPEIMIEVQNALEAKMDKIQSERVAAAIKSNAAEIFRPAASPIVGNTKGDVTVIEFFDYNCGYCKRAFEPMAKLVEGDKQIKLIMKELPILSKGSEEAAKVALAAKLQGKYWEFHRAMIEASGQASEASALRIAEKLNLDMARLKKDMASPAVKKEIDDTRNLAQKLGIQGTPHFFVGDRIIPGAPENLYEQLTKLVAEVRKEGCRVC